MYKKRAAFKRLLWAIFLAVLQFFDNICLIIFKHIFNSALSFSFNIFLPVLLSFSGNIVIIWSRIDKDNAVVAVGDSIPMDSYKQR